MIGTREESLSELFDSLRSVAEDRRASWFTERGFDGPMRQLLERMLAGEGVREDAFAGIDAGVDAGIDTATDAGSETVTDAETLRTAFLDGQLRAALRPAELPVIPRFRILSEIGEGGHGVVYLAASQTAVTGAACAVTEAVTGSSTGSSTGFGTGATTTSTLPQRFSAVKVLRADLASTSALRRFEAERAALLALDHPSIVAISDAGVAADGRPYFVMPLILGEPLTSACDAASIGIRERVELFRQVLAGVLHAHRRGILHRDIKPGNILAEPIEGGWRVRIIDWGLARALDDGETAAEALRTAALGGAIGTPEFMSPEQAEAGRSRIDTRADIWSLGALLYLLLGGALPYARDEVRGLSPRMLARHLREHRPPAPSRVARSAVDARRLEGDLDAIVMKALEPDPERRYPSVDAFDEDLAAWLAGQPVRARPESPARQFARLARRHRAATAAVLVVTASLVAATVVSADAARRANLARRHAETTAGFLTAMLGGVRPAVAKGRDRALMLDLLRDAAGRLPEADATDPIAAAEIRRALVEAWVAVGLVREARTVAREGLARLDGLVDERHPTLRGLLAAAYEVARLDDDHASMIAYGTRILRSGDRRAGWPYPVDPESLRILAGTLGKRLLPDAGLALVHILANEDNPRLVDGGARIADHVERVEGRASARAIQVRAALLRIRVDPDPSDALLAEVDELVERCGRDPANAANRAALLTIGGIALGIRGEYVRVLERSEAELPWLRETLGPDHYTLLVAEFNRTVSLATLGRFTEAVPACAAVACRLLETNDPNAPMPRWVVEHACQMMEGAPDPAAFLPEAERLLATYRRECAVAEAEPTLVPRIERAIATLVAARPAEDPREAP
ncbi:MAG: hypothetical protein RI967_1826 [Planctomycetota bacterium]